MKNLRKIEKINNLKPIIIKMHKKVAAYARVSVESDSLNNSLANQISYYKKLINNTKGYEFVKVYYDKGISGTETKKRDAFNEMIEDAKAGKIDLILTKSISRFARNTVDLLNTVRMLKSINVEVKFEKENISTMSVDGEFMLSILASFAQSESESISQNQRWTRRKSFEMGKDQFRPTFGYRNKNGEYIINSKEAEIVKYIFKLFLDGISYNEIARKVNKLNIKTKRNNKFNFGSIKCILRNERYIGDSLLQKSYVSDTLTHSKKRNKGELPQYYVKNTNPAIIDKKVFKKVQVMMKQKAELQEPWNKQHKWFTNLVVCPLCGRYFVRKGNNLRCNGNLKDKDCQNRQLLPIEKLEELIKGSDIKMIKQIIMKKTDFAKYTDRRYSPSRKELKYISMEDIEIIWKPS